MTRRAVGVLLAINGAGAAAGCGLVRVKPPPPAAGTRECIGLPEATCAFILTGGRNERVGVPLVAYRIRCAVASCTAEPGEASAALVWADGMTEDFSYAWVEP